MADLNTRVESFITMLLEVSGRARPADLDAHLATGADELLQAYAAVHGEMNLAFEGDALVLQAPSQPVAAVQPAAAVEPAAEPPQFAPEIEQSAAPLVAPMGEPPVASPEPAPFVFDPNSLPEVGVVEPVASAEAVVLAPVPPELDPGTSAAPVIPASDDSSFFEFEPLPVAAESGVGPAASADAELLFVPQPPVDEGTPALEESVPTAPAPLPDLWDLPSIEAPPSSIPEIIPADPLEGLDETDGF